MKRRLKRSITVEPPSEPAADANVVLQVKVWLVGISPMVWRRVLVPATFTLRELHGVHPALLRFYTVAYCTPCSPWLSISDQYRNYAWRRGALGVLHAILTPRIEVRFVACNMVLVPETWRASILLGWTAPRHRVPELGLRVTKSGAVHDPV
jgi:hypothetical protein